MMRELTRTELRHAAWMIYPQSTIPEICLDFRGSLNGSADGWSDEDNQKCVRFLNTCLETWNPTDDHFDSLVHQMILETLRLAKAELKDSDAWHPDDDWSEEETDVSTMERAK